jgi:N-acetylneuraminate lyase
MLNIEHFSGLFAAVHTPMDARGELELSRVPAQVEHVLADGVAGMFVCGTTGEFASLTVTERRRVLETFIECAQGRVPIIAHVGHTCLRDARALAQHAAAAGANAIAFSPPTYFVPASIDVLVDSCLQVAEAAPELPLLYYHIPAMTGMAIPLVDFLRDAGRRIPSLAGAKYTCETLNDFIQCVRLEGGRYLMMFGRDEMLLSALAAGATAAVGTSYNFAAPVYRALWNAYNAGRLETAREWQHRAAQMIRIMGGHGGVRASKTIMQLIDCDCGPVRLPLGPVDQAERAAIKKELDAIGFFKWREGC